MTSTCEQTDSKGRSPYRAACLALALTGALVFDPTAALAGSCKETMRVTEAQEDGSATKVNVHTTVRNETKYRNYDVVISKGGEEKQSGTIIARGVNGSNQISKLVRNTAGGTFRATINPAGEEDKVTVCTYKVSIGTDWTEWSLKQADSLACDGPAKVSCNKSFHPGKERWNTTFVISD